MMPKKSHGEFLVNLKNKHPDCKFEIVGVYSGWDKPIEVVCKSCGNLQDKKADSLLKGVGCTLCPDPRKHTTESFLEKLFTKFPEFKSRYDYSKLHVDGTSSRISYDCNVCGHTIEDQPANDHLNGYGCPSCAGNLRYNKQILIEKSIEKFGAIYDFSPTAEFKGKSSKIVIGCPKHGEVETTAGLHLKSVTGCPKCYRLSSEEILERFYRNKYNEMSTLPYLEKELEGKQRLRLITVQCPSHGEYRVPLTTVTASGGCLKCSQERSVGVFTKALIERNKESLLDKSVGIYLMRMRSENFDCYKLGLSKNIDARVKKLSKDTKSSIDILYYGVGNAYDTSKLEQELLLSLKPYKFDSGLSFGGSTELLILSDDMVSELIECLSKLTSECDNEY
jgi:protein-arginine kinase activator protein McsA